MIAPAADAGLLSDGPGILLTEGMVLAKVHCVIVLTLPRLQTSRIQAKADSLSKVKSLNLWGSDLGDVSILARCRHAEVLSLRCPRACCHVSLRSCEGRTAVPCANTGVSIQRE